MTIFKAVCLTSANQLKNDGTANIKIRLTHKRKVAYIPTDLYIAAAWFDNKKGEATGGGNKDHINLSILQKLVKYRTNDIKLGDARQFMSVADIRNHLLAGVAESTVIDFYVFAEKLIAETNTPGTAKTYLATLESLKNFKQSPLLTSGINLNFLHNYERYLRNNGVQNGIINYMKSFRSMFNKCRDLYNNEDTGQINIPNYPFRKYKMPRRLSSSNDHILTPAELRTLIAYETTTEGEQFAKDMFLLMFYLIGMESKDLFFVAKAKAGRIKYNRFKTGGGFSVKVEPEAKAIIARYTGAEKLLNVSERFALPANFYKHINNYLKGMPCRNIEGIFTQLKIYKPVTTKWARHTWATIASTECDIPKDDIALCLGHKDSANRVTDMYIKYDTRKIDAANRKVLDFIAGK